MWVNLEPFVFIITLYTDSVDLSDSNVLKTTEIEAERGKRLLLSVQFLIDGSQAAVHSRDYIYKNLSKKFES